MSRSYKKHPIVKDFNKGEKRLANRRVKSIQKQDPDAIGSNGAYKKAYEQWEISDYAFTVSEQEWKDLYYEYQNSKYEWERKRVQNMSMKRWMAEWRKIYKNK